MPRVIKVIQSDEPRGGGTSDDPCRAVVRYYTIKGVFLAENDPSRPRGEPSSAVLQALLRVAQLAECIYDPTDDLLDALKKCRSVGAM